MRSNEGQLGILQSSGFRGYMGMIQGSGLRDYIGFKVIGLRDYMIT